MVQPNDTPIYVTLYIAFRSDAIDIADRVNGLDELTSDDTSEIISHEYVLAYANPISGKQMHIVQVIYTGGNLDGTEINGARVFDIVVPDDAEIAYYTDSGNQGQFS
jgi:hypothetical protein